MFISGILHLQKEGKRRPNWGQIQDLGVRV